MAKRMISMRRNQRKNADETCAKPTFYQFSARTLLLICLESLRSTSRGGLLEQKGKRVPSAILLKPSTTNMQDQEPSANAAKITRRPPLRHALTQGFVDSILPREAPAGHHSGHPPRALRPARRLADEDLHHRLPLQRSHALAQGRHLPRLRARRRARAGASQTGTSSSRN